MTVRSILVAFTLCACALSSDEAASADSAKMDTDKLRRAIDKLGYKATLVV